MVVVCIGVWACVCVCLCVCLPVRALIKRSILANAQPFHSSDMYVFMQYVFLTHNGGGGTYSDADMLLGAHIEPRGNGTFRAPCTINLSRRSLLILAGNGANVAKHCIPAVQSRRISITLRRLPTWAREARDAAFPPPL